MSDLGAHTHNFEMRLSRSQIPLILIVIIGMAISLAAFFSFQQTERDARESAFRKVADDRIDALQSNIRSTFTVLQSIRGLYAASNYVDRQEFRRFVETLGLGSAVQAVEWIPRVLLSERPAMEALARQDGVVRFRFTERREQGDMVPAASRAEYFPVYFVEPVAGNEAAIGFDLASSPARLAALEQTRDSGEAVATPRITLVQETGDQYGFLVFLPIYRNGMPTETLDHRRANLAGFALGVFRIGDLVETATRDNETAEFAVSLQMFDASAPMESQRLYPKSAASDDDRTHASELHWSRTITVAGREWRVVVTPATISAFAEYLWKPWVILLAGLLFTGLLAQYLNVTRRRAVYVDKLVAKRTAELGKEVGERKAAEDSIRRSENRLQAVLDTAPDGVITIDNESIVRTFNPAAERIFGYGAAEVIGKNVKVLMEGENARNHDGYIKRYLESGGTSPVIGAARDLTGLRKDGSTFPLELALGEMEVDGERMFTGIIRNISERKEREETVHRHVENAEKASERLARSNAELEQFAYVASHDLQEPLRKVQAFSDRLRGKYKAALDEQGLDYLARMHDAAGRMQTLVNDLLAYSRVATKDEDFVPVALDSVVHDVVADLEMRIEETDARIEISDLPTIEAAPLQMRQLFQNLIANALKYHRKEAPPAVKVACEVVENGSIGFNGKPAKTCRIVVEDNGVGFEAQYAERIFGIFQRLHGRGEYEGTGIGLAVCRKIAERHGGTIAARSRPGEGSTFTVTLPLEHQILEYPRDEQ